MYISTDTDTTTKQWRNGTVYGTTSEPNYLNSIIPGAGTGSL